MIGTPPAAIHLTNMTDPIQEVVIRRHRPAPEGQDFIETIIETLMVVSQWRHLTWAVRRVDPTHIPQPAIHQIIRPHIEEVLWDHIHLIINI